MRKDIEEKLKEARRIIEHSDEMTPEVGGAAFFLLGEVERLQACLEAVGDLATSLERAQTKDRFRDENALGQMTGGLNAAKKIRKILEGLG